MDETDHHHTNGGSRSEVDRLTVAQVVAGSSPVCRPKTYIQRRIDRLRATNAEYREAYDEETREASL